VPREVPSRHLKSRVIADTPFPVDAETLGFGALGATPEIPYRHQMRTVEKAGHVGPEPGRDGGLLKQLLELPPMGLTKGAAVQAIHTEADLKTRGPIASRVQPHPRLIQEQEPSQARRQDQFSFPPPQHPFSRGRG